MRRALVLLGLAVCLSACSKKHYKMPSGSMWPSIPVGESVTADTSIKTPARGDVFVFKYPEHQDQMFVKRIVALGGDKVEMKGHVLSINGKALPSCVIGKTTLMDGETKHDGELSLEGGGYVVFYEALDGASFGDGAWTVAPGQFWAMGDNRNNSHDSRSWFGGQGGGVPQALLQGKVEGPRAVLPPAAAGLAANLDKCQKELGVSP